MVDIVVRDEGHEEHDGGHCPTCEVRFVALEQRIAAMEQHHPIMDGKTEAAQETANEAVGIAEEALEQAEEAMTATAATAIAEEERKEEELDEQAPTIDVESGDSSEGTSGQTEEPVVLAIEPEQPEHAKRRSGVRFARGRRRER